MTPRRYVFAAHNEAVSISRMGDSQINGSRSRYTALDGLRGLAALVVLFHHCFLISPQLAAAVEGTGTGPIESWAWWLTYTPLHLLWAGKEAVFVFFILSGFVLTLPFLRESRPSWMAYYPKRFVRIYLPAWASLAFALMLAWVWPVVADSSSSGYYNAHAQMPNVFRDALLLGGSGALNSPLWSLQWEMLFSLFLPVYLLAALRFRRLWFIGAVGLILLIGVGNVLHSTALIYMPMFGIGVLMACRRDLLEQLAGRLTRWSWAGIVTASLVLLCSNWIFPQVPGATSLATLGGAMLVFAFIAWSPVISLGRDPRVHWLGKRSFSLYLVHEPIVISVTVVLQTTHPLTVMLLAVPISLVAAEAFYRAVERPSHKLAGIVGNAFSRRDVPNASVAK